MKFNRLWFRIFVLLALLNGVLTLAVYLLNLWSFERSLQHYLNEQVEVRRTRLVSNLAEVYRQFGSWPAALVEPDRLEQVFLSILDDPGRMPPQPAERMNAPPAPPDSKSGGRLLMGLMLFDAQRKLLLGRQDMPWLPELTPIHVDGQVVAYLGQPPNRPLPQPVMQAFTEQQRQSFLLVALGMLGASILGAWGIARWLSRPINELARGTQVLIAGDCSIRLPERSEDELGQLARDFNVLAQTLAANRQSRREWIVNVAHELRTPLTVMLGEIEAVEDGIHQADAQWQARIAQKTRQLAILVNDLHQIALSDQGALTYHKTRLDLADLLQDILASHRFSFEHGCLWVSQTLAPASIMADRDRLRQLFANLVQNTLRYTDAPGTLRVSLRCETGQSVVTWEDSAPGVSEMELNRLTERLYRVEGSRNRAGGGSGLGLAIVKTIVEAHGGTLQAVRSDLGGLGWILRFPLAEEGA